MTENSRVRCWAADLAREQAIERAYQQMLASPTRTARKLTAEQVQFARTCLRMREKYPALTRLAKSCTNGPSERFTSPRYWRDSCALRESAAQMRARRGKQLKSCNGEATQPCGAIRLRPIRS